MSITVTADASSGAFANGISLRVEVLMNAAAVQNGAFAEAHTLSSALAKALTTTVIGSRVYGAALNNNTSYTVNGSTTAIDNIADATNSCRYGTCKQKTDTVTTGSETIGYSTTRTDGGIALYEVVPIAGRVLIEDGSAPAVKTVTNASVAVSNAFTPPQGSTLVALVSALSSGATITDSSGLTWTKQIAIGGTDGPGGLSDGTASVWTAHVPDPASGDPYLAAIGGWASGTSVTLPVLHDVAAGDVLIVETSTTGGIETAVPTDTQGNTYTSNQTNTGSQNSANFKCQVTTPLVAGTDTITCVRSNSTNNGNIIVAGVPNALATSPVEGSSVSKTASGTSTAPTVTSGTLSQASEVIIAAISDANVATSPVWASPFDQGVLGNEVIASGATRLSAAWARVAATTAVTAAGTLPSSATWEVLLTAIKLGAAGDAGTGSVKLKKMGLSGSGTETDSGTGSVKLKKMALAGTAVETEFGTGSVALKKMGVSGSGQETDHGTGSVKLKKMVLAGSGQETDTGTGSVKIHKMGLHGSGLPKWVGTGGVGLKKMGIAGAGLMTGPVLTNNFTGLSSGTTLTTGNTGGVSGDAFGAISIPAGGTLAADNTHVGIFPMSLKMATTSTTGSPAAEWLLAQLGVARSKLYFRIDNLKTASASPAWRPIAFRTTGGTHIFSILVSGNSVSGSSGSGFTGMGSFSSTVPSNVFFRVEGWIDTSAGTAHIEYYSTQTAAVPTEQHDYSGLTFGSSVQRVDVGNANSATSDGPFWINYAGVSPDGRLNPPTVALKKMGVSGVGGTGESGVISVALKKMSLSGTAWAPDIGHGSMRLKKMGVSGSGTETDHGTGSVRLKKMGVSGSGQETDTGTGSVHLKKMGLSGSGEFELQGTGSVQLKKMSLAGTAIETEFGTGSVSMKKMGVSGSGIETGVGTGSVSLHKMALSGTAHAPDIATGSVQLHKMGLSGIGFESGSDSGTGSVHIHKMGLSGSGQETDHGTGSVRLKKMGVSGSGDVVGSIGTVQLHKMALSGSGRETTSGSLHISMHKMHLSGSGTLTVPGTGSVRLKKMGVHATNIHGQASNLFIFTPV